MGCQKIIATKIIEKQSDYQKQLTAAIEGFFDAAAYTGHQGMTHTCAEWIDRNLTASRHGTGSSQMIYLGRYD